MEKYYNTCMRQDHSRNIIGKLAKKTAISVDELVDSHEGAQSNKYALVRSLKGLTEAGLIENLPSGRGIFARLTKEGKKKAYSLALDAEGVLAPISWDGLWRIVLLDLPEARKNEREALRYLLKKAGFVCIKNSVWVTPYPYEHLFINIKKDLNLTTEFMIIITQNLDPETQTEFFKTFGFGK